MPAGILKRSPHKDNIWREAYVVFRCLSITPTFFILYLYEVVMHSMIKTIPHHVLLLKVQHTCSKSDQSPNVPNIKGRVCKIFLKNKMSTFIGITLLNPHLWPLYISVSVSVFLNPPLCLFVHVLVVLGRFCRPYLYLRVKTKQNKKNNTISRHISEQQFF